MQLGKILLVDDDPDDISIITDALSALDAGSTVNHAENGEAALALLDQHAAPGNLPCLIVLDLNMPKINGTQTLKHLKKDDRFRDIPVIIYSTSVNPLEKEACKILGAHDYITKPVSYKESIETAKNFLDLCASGRST